MQALLDEDDTQSQNKIAEMLNVTQKTISNHLGTIQKCGKFVHHKLTERLMENRKALVKFCLPDRKENVFLHRIVTGDLKWIYFENPKCKKSRSSCKNTKSIR